LPSFHRIIQINDAEIRNAPCERHFFKTHGKWYGPYGRKADVVDPVIFVTAKFGPHHKFHDDLIAHASCVWRSGPFDLADMHVYSALPNWITDDPRWNRHIQFYTNPDQDDETRRGGGYWFWKSVLLVHHLHDLSEGSWLVYSDADRVDFIEYIADLIEHMQADGADLAINQHGKACPEHNFTKGDVYSYFGLTEDQMDKDVEAQYHANLIVIRKTSATVKFFSECEKGVENYHLVSDEESTVKSKNFWTHRHDQSFISMMLKHKFNEPEKKLYRENGLEGWNEEFLYTFNMMASSYMKGNNTNFRMIDEVDK